MTLPYGTALQFSAELRKPSGKTPGEAFTVIKGTQIDGAGTNRGKAATWSAQFGGSQISGIFWTQGKMLKVQIGLSTEEIPLNLKDCALDSPDAVRIASPSIGPGPYMLELRSFSLEGHPFWTVRTASASVNVDAKTGAIRP